MKRPRKLATDRARRFCQALGDLSDRQPQRWRMLDSVARRLGVLWDDAEAAANEAAAQGWLTVQGNSVCLTEEGRQATAAAARASSPTAKRERKD